MDECIRIGIIGAAADRGWARVSHIPAIAALPELRLQAVATTSDASARKAADAFGAALAFGDPAELIASDKVDAVVIAVKVTDHFSLVQQALDRGKAVYCEWPLGQSLEETRTLAEIASRAGVATTVGLQGRSSPWIRYLAWLVRQGSIGRVLSTTIVADDELSLGTIEAANAYMLERSNGANPLTIHGGHFVDTMCHVLGEFATLSAALSTSRAQVEVRETGEVVQSTSPDQVAIIGRLEDGAMASVQIRAGSTGSPSMLWEIQGEEGTIRATARGYMHWWPLSLERWDGHDWVALSGPAPGDFPSGLDLAHGPPQNIAYHYRAFAGQIRDGSDGVATFRDALRRHLTVQAIAEAARTGRSVPLLVEKRSTDAPIVGEASS